jgi:hypothetical protein
MTKKSPDLLIYFIVNIQYIIRAPTYVRMQIFTVDRPKPLKPGTAGHCLKSNVNQLSLDVPDDSHLAVSFVKYRQMMMLPYCEGIVSSFIRKRFLGQNIISSVLGRSCSTSLNGKISCYEIGLGFLSVAGIYHACHWSFFLSSCSWPRKGRMSSLLIRYRPPPQLWAGSPLNVTGY